MDVLVHQGACNGDTSKPINVYVTYSVSQNTSTMISTITLGMYVTTPQYWNIGPWSEYVSSYVGTSSMTFDGAIPNFEGARSLCSGKTMTVDQSNGTTTATISWRWGVRSNWGQCWEPSGSFTINLPALVKYKVYYNANGGTSTPSTQEVTAGGSVNLANAISRNNTDSNVSLTLSYNANGGSGAPGSSSLNAVNTTPYSFEKWHAGSTSGTGYSAGTPYTPTGDVTMYAGWMAGTTTRKSNPTFTISSTKPTWTYYTFKGWSKTQKSASTSATAEYASGGSITISANTTLYAVWSPNAPTNLSFSRTGSSTTSISLSLSATGLTMTNYTVYYRANSTGSYSSVSFGSSSTGSISGLAVDTNYQIYFTATNAGGTTTSGTQVFSTTLTSPTITAPTKSKLLPFWCTITATGSITPSRTLTYRFSKDDGATWTAYQSSNVYKWEDLTPETTYKMKVQVNAAHVGTNASDTSAVSSALSVTTPTNQYRGRIKKDGEWKKGRIYLKKDNEWKKAVGAYIKINDQWVECKNFYEGEYPWR